MHIYHLLFDYKSASSSSLVLAYRFRHFLKNSSQNKCECILKYAHFTDTPMTTSGVYLYYVQKILYLKFAKEFNPSIDLGLRLPWLVCEKIICEKQTFSNFYFNFFILTSFLFCTSIKSYAYIKVIGTPQPRHVLEICLFLRQFLASLCLWGKKCSVYAFIYYIP